MILYRKKNRIVSFVKTNLLVLLFFNKDIVIPMCFSFKVSISSKNYYDVNMKGVVHNVAGQRGY